MKTKGERTREHILETAEGIILQRGFVGTSIENILEQARITKGGFFYHFDGKIDLARKLLERYLVQDAEFFGMLEKQARDLSEDPLQQLLIFLKLMAQSMADLPGTHPGCLVAAFTYESQQFDDEIRTLTAEGARSWRRFFLELFTRIEEKYPMRTDQPLEELAEMLIVILEGGIIVSKIADNQQILPQQLLQYRNYLRLLYGDA